MSKLKQRIINLPEFIAFTSGTKDYGRAEFSICPIFKRKKLVQVIISPLQQPNAKEEFIVNCKLGGIYFQSYEGLEPAKIWSSCWCEIHKCFSLRLYVPAGSNFLHLDYSLGSLGFCFTKTRWK